MAAPPEARNERNVLILTGVGHFGTHFFELMFPTLAVALAQQSGLPLEAVLAWSFGGYLLFGLGALPAGMLADHVGARPLLLVAMFGIGVAALAAGEVPPGRPLAVCLAIMGLFGSVYHPVGMSLISRSIDARGRALGVNGIFGNAAIASTPIITAALCGRVGWQATYQIAGFAMCAIAVACAFLRIDEPRRPPAAVRMVPGSGRSPVLFLVLLAAAMLGGISYRGNTLIQPAYFAEHVSQIGFGAATSLVYVFGIAGQYAGGVLADRYDLRWTYLLFHALSLPALLGMAALAGVPLIGAGALFVFFSLGMQPIENSLFAHFTPPRWRATAYGAKFVLTFGVGSLAVWLVGWADRAGGLRYALLCLCGVVVLIVLTAALFAAVSGGTRRRAVAELPAGAAPDRVAVEV